MWCTLKHGSDTAQDGFHGGFLAAKEGIGHLGLGKYRANVTDFGRPNHNAVLVRYGTCVPCTASVTVGAGVTVGTSVAIAVAVAVVGSAAVVVVVGRLVFATHRHRHRAKHFVVAQVGDVVYNM